MSTFERRARCPATCLAALALLLAGSASATVNPENKWRLQCSGGANSDGTIVFRVTPEGGKAVDVAVKVKDGTGENAVAKTIRDAFRASLAKDAFAIETDDGEDVLVKKRHGKPSFALELISDDVEGVRVNVDRE